MSNRRGFSLAEVLTATAVIAVGLLAVFASLAFGVSANRHGELTTQATNLDREVIDLIKGRGWAFKQNYVAAYFNDAPGARVRIDAAPFEEDLVKYKGSSFKRNIQIDRLNTGGFENNIATVKVTIFWRQGATEHHVTYETYDRP